MTGTRPGELPGFEEPYHQPYAYQEPQYGATYETAPQPAYQYQAQRPGPAMGLPQSGKFGLAIMVIAIIGLVLCFAVPWITYHSDDETQRAWYDRNLRVIEDQSSDSAPEKLATGDTKDYFDWGLAFLAMLLMIIFGAIVMVVGFIQDIPRLAATVIRLVSGLVLIFSAVLLVYAVARPMGQFMIIDNMEADEGFILTPTPLVLFILGIVAFALSVGIVGRETTVIVMEDLSPRRPAVAAYAPPPPVQARREPGCSGARGSHSPRGVRRILRAAIAWASSGPPPWSACRTSCGIPASVRQSRPRFLRRSRVGHEANARGVAFFAAC